MIRNIVGMLVGAELSERDGESGIKGALEGYVTEGAARLVAPLAVTFAIGWSGRLLARHAVNALTGDADLKRRTAPAD